MKRSSLSVLTLILLAAAPASFAEPAAWRETSRPPQTLEAPLASDPLQVSVHRLSNGFTVYLSPNPQEPRVSAWIAVRAGSRHDPSESTGMAHYLEHMLFKGSSKLGTLDYSTEKDHLERISKLYEDLFKATDTARRREVYGRIDEVNIAASRYAVPNEIDKAYKSMGFRGINAFTSNERTVYVCDMPKNRMPAWAKLESDRFSKPVFRLFQSELEAVYEEKNRSLDNAGRILNEALGKALFGAHPYGRTTLGSIEHLKNPSLAKMYVFYDKFYAPNNMAIALAGDFDRKETLALLEKTFGALKPKPLAAPEPFEVPKATGVVRTEVAYEAEEQVILAWPLPPFGHPDRDALTVLDMVMDNSAAGIINLDLVQAQKVKSAGSGPDFMNEAGAWYLWAVPKDSQTLEQAEALLLETLETLKSGAFSEEDLKAVITDFEIGEKRKLESNDARVSVMADSFLRYQDWPQAAGRLERLRKVSKEDVLWAARAYLGEGRVAAYRRRGKPEIPSMPKPGFTKLEIDRARESKFYREIAAMPAKPIEPRWIAENKDYSRLKTPWGELITAKNPINDLFALSFVFDRGRRHERNLCAAMDLLDLSGAGDMSAERFKKALYALGTTLSTGCGEETSSVYLAGIESNLEKSLGLMRLHFEKPNTASDALAKYVEVGIGAHKDNKVDPGYVMSALGEWAQRGKESGVLSELGDAELKGLREAELHALIGGVFAFQRKTGYVGLRAAGEVAKLLEELGKSYLAPPAKTPRLYRKPGKPEVFFTHRDMVQSQVGLFAADGTVDPAQVVDYQYYANYMGGGMSAVIFQEIREARSLAYSAGGGYDYGNRLGDENRLYGRLGTQADKTVEASTLLRDLLTEPPFSDSRFAETKKSIEQSYRTNPITFRAVPGAVMGWQELGLPGDPRPERFQKALSYTPERLKAFARRFKDKPKTLYILGNRGRVDLPGLGKLGEVVEKPIDELFPY
ncbi:MAG: insulinase family protein [Elusimicrobiota bacterium]